VNARKIVCPPTTHLKVEVLT